MALIKLCFSNCPWLYIHCYETNITQLQTYTLYHFPYLAVFEQHNITLENKTLSYLKKKHVPLNTLLLLPLITKPQFMWFLFLEEVKSVSESNHKIKLQSIACFYTWCWTWPLKANLFNTLFPYAVWDWLDSSKQQLRSVHALELSWSSWDTTAEVSFSMQLRFFKYALTHINLSRG